MSSINFFVWDERFFTSAWCKWMDVTEWSKTSKLPKPLLSEIFTFTDDDQVHLISSAFD